MQTYYKCASEVCLLIKNAWVRSVRDPNKIYNNNKIKVEILNLRKYTCIKTAEQQQIDNIK